MNSSVSIEQTDVARDTSRKPIRRLWVLVHRYAGLFIALFLIVAGVTGSAIAFYTELDRALNPDLYRIVERAEPPLSATALAQKVGDAFPQTYINLMTLKRAPGESVRVRLTQRPDATAAAPPLRWTEIFIDPFDGRILGGRYQGALQFDRAHLMPFIYRVHYTLYLPDPWGTWLMGIVALVWLFDCFVGFYLTLPAASRAKNSLARKSWWRRWQPAWQIKRRASAKRVVFDAHRAGGLWFWIVLLVLALTSVYFNLTREVFRPVLGWIAPLSPEVTPVLKLLPQAASMPTLSFDEALARAHASRSSATRNMEPSYIGLTKDAPGIYRMRFADVGRGDISWHFHYENLFIDGADGNLLLRTNYENGTAADRFLLWQYPLHSGQIFGFWGRGFIAVTGLIVAMLSITGIILWYRKRRGRGATRDRILTGNSRRADATGRHEKISVLTF